MVVIGRGEGETRHDADTPQTQESSETRYADHDVVLQLAGRIAESNAELMRRLA